MGAMTRMVSPGSSTIWGSGLTLTPVRALVHDDVDPLVGLDLADGPAHQPAGGADRDVGEVDVLAGELKPLVDLSPGRRGDERRRGDLRGRDRRHRERAGDLGGQGFVEQADHDLGRRGSSRAR